MLVSRSAMETSILLQPDQYRDDGDHHQKAGAVKDRSADGHGQPLYGSACYFALDAHRLANQRRILRFGDDARNGQAIALQRRGLQIDVRAHRVMEVVSQGDEAWRRWERGVADRDVGFGI